MNIFALKFSETDRLLWRQSKKGVSVKHDISIGKNYHRIAGECQKMPR